MIRFDTKKDYEIYIQEKEEKIKLQNNWNELKKWLEEQIKILDKENPMGHDEISTAYESAYDIVLDKMQELEQGKDD